MADGITTAAASLAAGGVGVGLAAMLPGVDIQSVIGSFGGAFFFVLFAKDINNWQRFGYLIVGWIGGYLGAAELMARGYITTPGFWSFFCGLTCITVGISIVEFVDTGKLPKWLGWVFSRFGPRGEKQP